MKGFRISARRSAPAAGPAGFSGRGGTGIPAADGGAVWLCRCNRRTCRDTETIRRGPVGMPLFYGT